MSAKKPPSPPTARKEGEVGDYERYGLTPHEEVTEAAAKLAHERTEGMVHYAMRYGAGPRCIPELAASAYLQGVRDTAEAQALAAKPAGVCTDEPGIESAIEAQRRIAAYVDSIGRDKP